MEHKGSRYHKSLVTHYDPLSIASEAFKIARTNIEFSSIDHKLKTIVITSSNQSEGKTTTLANLAISYAQIGRRVLLVDADMRRPSIHKLFGVANRRGLTNALLNHNDLESIVVQTKTPGLDILTSGPIPPNPAELLMSESMTTLIEQAKSSYDLIMFDCAPVGAVTDAAIMSTKTDAVVFVVKAGHTDRHQLKRSALLLHQVNARILGYILTGVSRKNNDSYYYYAKAYVENSDNRRKGKRNMKSSADRTAALQQYENPNFNIGSFSSQADIMGDVNESNIRKVTSVNDEVESVLRRTSINGSNQGIVSEDD